MSVTGLDHYNLRAPRPLLDTLRDFYVDVVGLRPGDRPPFRSHGYWLYAGAQAVLHLSEASPGESRAPNVTNTFDHVAFACSDLPETIARLQRFGIRFSSADVPLTRQHQLFFDDPAGNGVELNFAANVDG
ncbi:MULTISPECIES: VOC family protein [Burkholderia]|uniref:Diguanylate cyclase n=1 Tax=Burkholderia savannae TaxID=1637837 RepID=A0ABR5T712_9BURK|nr:MULTISPECIES: VOC family protein [Burkholderia]AOJ72405.1 diguanylate cyclase [Burkholderia savannae]AOJ82956.1 diguanylate cyclase [Burkholderia savannae]AOK50798.1 diguanylate cyclase [Burkholderia sp. MSMB617WGS]KGR93016.1 glyoxalase-like domain protein [Burkholderia sp. ABCPW 111]KVG46268.1 diguanylate cyclase [Burkholderia sp. MSMB0265]